MPRLSDFSVLTFDCYGTLIDWETGMIEGLKPLTDRVDKDLTRDEILQAHARHESSQQAQTPAKLYRDLLPIVYDELRSLAARKLAQERPGQTLQATALVHEAYIRLVDTERIELNRHIS